MRDLAVVMGKRNALVKELEKVEELQEKLFPSFVGSDFRHLGQEQKQKYHFLNSVKHKTQEQIAVLNFILNEDTDWKDAKENKFFSFSMEDLYKEANECKCNCKCKHCTYKLWCSQQ